MVKVCLQSTGCDQLKGISLSPKRILNKLPESHYQTSKRSSTCHSRWNVDYLVKPSRYIFPLSTAYSWRHSRNGCGNIEQEQGTWFRIVCLSSLPQSKLSDEEHLVGKRIVGRNRSNNQDHLFASHPKQIELAMLFLVQMKYCSYHEAAQMICK